MIFINPYKYIRRIMKEVLLMSILILHNLCYVKTNLCDVKPKMARSSHWTKCPHHQVGQ